MRLKGFFCCLFDFAAKFCVSLDPFFALLGEASCPAHSAASVSLEQSYIKAGLGLAQVAPGLSIAYPKRLTGSIQRPFAINCLKKPPFAVTENPFNIFAIEPKLEPDPHFFHILGSFLQLLEAAKLALTDSYVVLITNPANLNNCRVEFLGKLKGLGTGQLLLRLGFLGPCDDRINQVFLFAHFMFPVMIHLVMHNSTGRKQKDNTIKER
jgi:hypothetical protein